MSCIVPCEHDARMFVVKFASRWLTRAWKRGQEPIVRSTLWAIWLLVPDPFSKRSYSSTSAAMVEHLFDPTQVSNQFMPRPLQDSQTFSHLKAAKDAQ